MKLSGLMSVSMALLLAVTSSRSLSAQSNRAYLTNVVSQQTCPVSMAAPTRRGNTLHLEFRNSSSKRIRGILFGAAYYDGNDTVHVIQVLTDEHRLIPSGAVKTGDLNISYWRRTNFSGWSTWPSKILYADGSSWQINPNAMSCVASYWRNGQQPRTLLASDIHLDAPVEVAQTADSAGLPGSDR